MRKVQRPDILDYETYGDRREAMRQAVMKTKHARRVHVGAYLTFLFENTETIRYQIQEMMRVERMVRESDVQQEIDTYNAVLGDEGELGCCLLVEIDDKAERDRLLRQWRKLPEHLYLKLADGTMVRPRFDRAQVAEEKISSVQYLKFTVGAGRPVALGSDLPDLIVEAALTEEQQAALLEDLRGEPG
jgi:hypothetical protein